MILRHKPRNHRGDFEVQITKPDLPVLRPKPENPPPPWFWGSTKKPIVGFEAKPRETVATSFEAKLEKTVATVFEAKLDKTVTAGSEVKPLETVATGFEAKPLKLSILVLRLNQETHAPHLHVHGADRTRRHPTSRSPGHLVPNLCDHPRSSAPGLLLLPRSPSLHAMPHLPHAHHETSKRDSPNETKIKEKAKQNCPGFEFKHHQVNDSSQSNQGTDHLVSQVECSSNTDMGEYFQNKLNFKP
jgi:hypothetical protein